ncbi:MAG: 1-acyl-sn-glycerol-3-phosphate acyltransferase [Oscillospiraceae bacterium]|nr:1-acyl-sn-glycerol-3-phosphate acyltransferase [Oscillospiraceae bacterium]
MESSIGIEESKGEKSITGSAFRHISLFRRAFMPLSELEAYYCERRKYRFEQGKKLKHIRLRKAFGPVFAKLLTLDRIFRKQTVTVIGNQKKYKDRVIFACTHIGENDLENIYEVLHHSCWWFVGDPCVLYKDISGLLVYLNGCILLETADMDDRHIAYLRSVELLKGNGSLMIFPEGARNGSENLPVMSLFSGTAKMAIETNTKIVPIAIEQYDKRFVVNFGTEISPKDFRDIAELTQKLRDALASLKWDIWEREGLLSRDSLPENYSEQFIKTFEKRIQPWDTPESIERARFHTKAEIEQKDAFAHLEHLNTCRENAFLLRR